MGDMARCPRCQTHHYRNDPCPHEPEPEYIIGSMDEFVGLDTMLADAGRHFVSDAIEPRRTPLTDEEISALIDDDNRAFDDDMGEPTGSCEHCGTNLYDDEGPLCNQCEWSVNMGASRSNEEVL